MKIAILGASGHIATNIVAGMINKEAHELYLFSRTPGRIASFVKQLGGSQSVQIATYEQFNHYRYDVIINGVGIGDPGTLNQQVSTIIPLTEQYDNFVLDYLHDRPDTLYINLSSGAAYGSDFEDPADLGATTTFAVNQLSARDYYGIAKFYSEAKHRSMSNLNILDLRVFGFFSKYVPADSKFLLTEIVNSIKNNQILKTNRSNIVRDYIHPDDLLQLIEMCISRHNINAAYDVYSLAPIAKFDILNSFASRFGLNYQIIEQDGATTVTGTKPNYFSRLYSARELGFTPQYTSLEGILEICTSIIDEGILS